MIDSTYRTEVVGIKEIMNVGDGVEILEELYS